ncbi:MAG: hypothetical protein KAW45_00690 [Thermoplasmatales archaeon]|nr:hypothetical protein [Thermoplasmatales archaeon]
MKFEEKGMIAPFTLITSIITGSIFPLLGSLIALDLKVIEDIYLTGIILVMIGGFIANWILAHSIHDLFHTNVEKRKTFSKKTLKILIAISTIILFTIALYLTLKRGWPVMVFAMIGFLVSLYAEGLFHHESQMAFGAMFLVMGGFYVQAATLDISFIIWLKVIFVAIFAFLSQYGWLLFYRLDDYDWNIKKKNMSILITKAALIFLILYFLL